MPLIVEDGSNVSGANSYASENDLDTYADDREFTLGSGDAEAALIRATAYIDITYRSRFPGQRKAGRSQSLEWPRTNVLTDDDQEIPDDEIPIELIQATCEAAIREISNPGSLLPDSTPSEEIVSESIGSMSVTYKSALVNNKTSPTLLIIDGIIAPILLSSSGASGFFMRG